MPGFLPHSPQRIISAYLIEIGLAANVDENGIPSRRVGLFMMDREPDRPDKIVKITGTVGRSFGYTQVDSERQEMNGIQIMIRGSGMMISLGYIFNISQLALDVITDVHYSSSITSWITIS